MIAESNPSIVPLAVADRWVKALSGTTLSFMKITFFVEDTGIGIDYDKLERVFATFSQEENSMARSYEGLGLGLSISKQYVELLDGEIKVNTHMKGESKELKYKSEDYEKLSDIVEVWFDSGSTHSFVLEKREDLKWPASMYLEDVVRDYRQVEMKV